MLLPASMNQAGSKTSEGSATTNAHAKNYPSRE
jgi:hypothetical protein